MPEPQIDAELLRRLELAIAKYPQSPGCVALLVLRGCPPEALDRAKAWIGPKHPPPSATGVLADIDEAIRIATEAES